MPLSSSSRSRRPSRSPNGQNDYRAPRSISLSKPFTVGQRRPPIRRHMSDAQDRLRLLTAGVTAGLHAIATPGSVGIRYVTGVIIPRLQSVVNDVCDVIDRNHLITQTTDDHSTTVVHYSSITALVSMLHECATYRQASSPNAATSCPTAPKPPHLRMYDSAHFNDPDEGNYFARHLNLPDQHRWIGTSDVTHAYVASFILPDNNPHDAADNLVFWRTYGREGTGCSLILNLPSAKLRSVRYDRHAPAKVAKLLLPVLRILRPLITQARATSRRQRNESPIVTALRAALWAPFGRILFLYKSEAYSYEKEARILRASSDVSPEQVCFDFQERSRSSRLRHYYEDSDLQLTKKGVITSDSVITLGPCVPDKEDLRRSLEILKQRAKLDAVVKTSKITYRSV